MKQQLTPELAIVEFEAHLKKAEIVPEINITHLQTLATKAQALVDVDITDNMVMKEVATVRKELVSERRKIQADGKSARDEHTKINKAIKQVEDFLVGILGEDEERLKEYERQRKEMDIKEERQKTLPQRKQLLAGIGDDVEITDDEILLMDDATFLNYVTDRQSAKVEADRFEEEARQAEEARKEAEAQRIKDAEEKARLDAEERVRREAEEKHQAEMKAKQDEIDRINKEKADEEDRIKAEKEAEEARLKDEADAKAKMEAEADYQKWLKDHDYDPATDKIEDTGIDVVMYRKVAVYSKEI
jgi:chromosome segregation ATPase